MKNNENGRSMIEMLGVLAIIGVLSVGGIAGYSKAMMKYRTNKTIEQISMIVTNIRTLFGSQKNYNALGDKGVGASGGNDALIAKAHLFPDELIDVANNKVIENSNPFGGAIDLVYASRAASGDKKAFMIVYKGIPEEACMDLITQDWGSASGSGLIVAGAGSTTTTVKATAIKTAVLTTNLQGCKSTGAADQVVCGGQGSMTAAEASAACDGDSNEIYLKFY